MPETNIGGNDPMWIRLMEKFGLPTVISTALLAALLGWIPSPLLQKMNNIEYQAWQTNMLLRAICYEITRSSADRATIHRCEPWKPYFDEK